MRLDDNYKNAKNTSATGLKGSEAAKGGYLSQRRVKKKKRENRGKHSCRHRPRTAQAFFSCVLMPSRCVGINRRRLCHRHKLLCFCGCIHDWSGSDFLTQGLVVSAAGAASGATMAVGAAAGAGGAVSISAVVPEPLATGSATGAETGVG